MTDAQIKTIESLRDLYYGNMEGCDTLKEMLFWESLFVAADLILGAMLADKEGKLSDLILYQPEPELENLEKATF